MSSTPGGDFSFVGELIDDFELVTSPENLDAGVYRGEAARRWLVAWVESFEQLTVEATEIIDAGAKVIVGIFQQGRPHGSPAALEGRWWQVMTFRRDELVRLETFPERAHALEAAGLSE